MVYSTGVISGCSDFNLPFWGQLLHLMLTLFIPWSSHCGLSKNMFSFGFPPPLAFLIILLLFSIQVGSLSLQYASVNGFTKSCEGGRGKRGLIKKLIFWFSTQMNYLKIRFLPFKRQGLSNSTLPSTCS